MFGSISEKILINDLSKDVGFFKYGPDTVCYGRSSAGYVRLQIKPDLYDVIGDVGWSEHGVRLPCDPAEIIDNLRLERYAKAQDSRIRTNARRAYYLLRPVLTRSVTT